MKVLKWILIILAVLAVIAFAGFNYMKSQTKKASPERTEVYNSNGKEMSVFYCSPSKKGRQIFGGLVPYGEVWRTGANEATTFTTKQDINFGGKDLKAGTYTLWTIPNEKNWTVILNSKMYGWGVNFDGKVTKEDEFDVLSIESQVLTLQNDMVEQFTMRFNPIGNLLLEWDKTRIEVRIR